MGADNPNPLDELKSLDQQVDLATDLAALKPIFYRLDEIAKLHSSDFEVQLVVGDIKQHLVTRGTRIREQKQTAPSAPPPPPPVAPPVAHAAAPPPLPPPIPASIPVPDLPTVEQTLPTMPAVPIPVPPPVVTSEPPRTVPPIPPPPRPRPQPTAAAPVNWKRSLIVGGLVGAVVAIALIATLVNQSRKRTRLKAATAAVQVQVATAPAGAAIRIASGQAGAETQCTSECNIQLAPGTYQVNAFLDGYQPAASELTVTAGKPGSVSINLEPQPQTVRVLTDIDQGKISVDNQPPVDMQEGQFILDKVAAGSHTLKVTGKNGDALFSFEIADAKIPLIGGVATHNLAAVLVASLGAQGHVVTSAGPMKLALNGQPQGDAGPAGVDLKDFQPGVDELVLGEGKTQRNFKESFGPAPMLTVFLKSDANEGTLIVSTGENDVHVFVNDKEYRRRTARGQVRIQTLGKATVRVAKDGFQDEPAQTAEVKKGDEVRLEFSLKPMPKVALLQIRGGTPGAEVVLDQKSIGSVGADGTFTYTSVPPGDRTVELRRDQFAPKRIQRAFKAGQIVVLSGTDVVLASSTGVVKFARTPAAAVVSYRRADETAAHEVSGAQIELPAGNYVFSAKAPGFAERTERVQLASGENRAVEFTLARELPTTPAPPPVAGIGDFEDPNAFKKDGDMWVHKGAGFIPFKGTKGVFTFTVELLKGGGVFRGGRVRWAIQYVDAKNYLLFEIDRKNFWAEVMENGKKLEREKTQLDLDNQKSFTVQIEVSPQMLVHKIRKGNDWMVLDSFSEPGRNFTQGKFGFLVQGNDEIGISDFKFTPK